MNKIYIIYKESSFFYKSILGYVSTKEEALNIVHEAKNSDIYCEEVDYYKPKNMD